ncbi:MAG: hypothetical protein HY670_07395, partial [Chloroflexi bacterium]|nr:hypothetical protein [Chloroflexota bacterium]
FYITTVPFGASVFRSFRLSAKPAFLPPASWRVSSGRFYDRGETVVRAQVTERIMPGVVDLPHGAWYRPDEKGIDRGGCPNVLTSEVYSPAGAYAYNTCLVQVAKAQTQ